MLFQVIKYSRLPTLLRQPGAKSLQAFVTKGSSRNFLSVENHRTGQKALLSGCAVRQTNVKYSPLSFEPEYPMDNFSTQEPDVSHPTLEESRLSGQGAPVLSSLSLGAVASIDLNLEKGNTKLAIEELATFLKESQDISEAVEVSKSIIPKFFNYQILHFEPAKLRTLETFVKRNFFKEECKSLDLWNRVARNTIHTAINLRMFNQWEDFGATFSGIISTITKVMGQKSAEQAITLILDQIDPENKALACNTLFTSFTVTHTSTVFTNFTFELLIRMHDLNLQPSAEAYACVIDRFLSRVMMKSPKSPTYMETVMNLFNKSLEKTTLEEWVYISLLSALNKMAVQSTEGPLNEHYESEMRDVAVRMIKCGYMIPKNLAFPLLYSMIPKKNVDACLDDNFKSPNRSWSATAISALWDSVKETKALSNDKCFFIISHCYPTVAQLSFQAKATLKTLFQNYIFIANKTNPKNYVAIASAYGHIKALPDLLNLMDIMRDNEAYPDARLLCTITRACIDSGDSAAALDTYHAYIESQGNLRRFNPLKPSKECLSLAFKAACNSNDSMLAQNYYNSIFEVCDIPLNWAGYHYILSGLEAVLANSNPASKKKLAFDPKWVVNQVDAILAHMKATKYVGPLFSLYQIAVRARAHYLKKIHPEESLDNAYQAMILTFTTLICVRSFKPDVTTTTTLIKAMSHAVQVQPDLSQKAVSDIDKIYRYFNDSGLKIECQVYSCIINFFGSVGETRLIEEVFERFLSACRCESFQDHFRLTTVFNTYFKNVLIQAGRIPDLLSQMTQHKAKPDEHTFVQIFRNLSTQKPSLEVLHNVLNLYKNFATFISSDKKVQKKTFGITISLLGIVATTFHKAGDVGEMKKGINFILALDKSGSLRKSLPVPYYRSIIELTLLPSEKNDGEATMQWLEKLRTSKDACANLKAAQEVLDLVRNADKSNLPFLETPESISYLENFQPEKKSS